MSSRDLAEASQAEKETEALLRDAVDGQVGRLQQAPGEQDALRDEPMSRTGPGGLGERPLEAPPAHPGVIGQVGDPDRLGQTFGGPVDGVSDAGPARAGRLRRLDELALPALPRRWHDEPAGEGGGRGGAVIGPDQVQAQVQPADHSRRRQDRSVGGEQDVAPDDSARGRARERVEQAPVGGGLPTVEEAGGGECERARAQRGHHGARRVRGPQRRNGVGGHRCVGVAPPGDHDQVAAAQRVEVVVGRELPYRHERLGPVTAHPQLERPDAGVGAVDAPHLCGDGDVESPGTGQQEQSDHAHGVKVSHRADFATRGMFRRAAASTP
jgi:hypothetical protein